MNSGSESSFRANFTHASSSHLFIWVTFWLVSQVMTSQYDFSLSAWDVETVPEHEQSITHH